MNPKRFVYVALIIVDLALIFSGCSSTHAHVEYDPEGRVTKADLASTNVLNNRTASLDRDDKGRLSLTYGSNPNEALGGQALVTVGKALDKIPAVPVPGAP